MSKKFQVKLNLNKVVVSKLTPNEGDNILGGKVPGTYDCTTPPAPTEDCGGPRSRCS